MKAVERNHVLGWVAAAVAIAVAYAVVARDIQWGQPHTTRVSVAVALAIVVLQVTLFFSRATLRVVALLVLALSALLIGNVGDNQRERDDHQEFLQTAEDLENELLLLTSAQAMAAPSQADAAADRAELAASQAELDASSARIAALNSQSGTGGVELFAEEAAQVLEDIRADSASALSDLRAENERLVQELAEQIGEQLERLGTVEITAVEAADVAEEVTDQPQSFEDAVEELTAVAETEPRTALIRLNERFRDQLDSISLQATDERRAALAARRQEVADSIDRLQDDPTAQELIRNGSDALLGGALSGVVADEVEVSIGGFGWLVLLVLAVLAYRQLEIANGRRNPGPVVVEPSPAAAAEATKNESQKAANEVRAWLAGVDIVEPSAVPGGEATAQVAHLLQGDAISNRFVGAAVSFLQATAFPATGYVAEIESRLGGLHIRLRDRRTNRLILAQQVSDDADCSSAERSAHLIAQTLISRSSTTPRWARWYSETGAGLGSYQRVMTALGDPSTETPTDEKERLLRAAVASSPATGIALVALGNQRSESGKLDEALAFYTRALSLNQHHILAAYRVAVTLSMIATDTDRYWTDHDAKSTVRSILGRKPYDLELSDDPRSLNQAAKALAFPRRGQLRIPGWWRSGGVCFLWWALWHPQERLAWLQLWRDRQLRTQLRAGLQIFQQLLELRLATNAIGGTGEVDKAADKAKLNALTRYNAACYYSSRAEALASGPLAVATVDSANPSISATERAAWHLIESRAGRNGRLIDLEWACIDPDLDYLRRSTEWRRVKRVLEAYDSHQVDGAHDEAAQ